MALGDPYATLPELKARLRAGGVISDTNDDAGMTNALKTASEDIELYCDRQFNKATTATARVFPVELSYLAEVDDFHTVTDLVIATDSSGDGTYDQTWSAADYQLEPLNGMVNGQLGWPYSEIHAVGSLRFPCTRRASLQVTAQWGWAAVPATIKEVCLMVAQEVFKLKDAAFGVAGVNDFGVVRVRENPLAVAKLARYRTEAVRVG